MSDGVHRGKRTRQVTRDYLDDRGEVTTLTHEEPVVPRRRPGAEQAGDPFMLAFDLKELAKHRLSPLQWQCLLWLAGESPLGRPDFRYSNAELATALDANPANTSQAVRALRDAGLVIDAPDAPGTRRWPGILLNPHYFWRGKPIERRKLLWTNPS